MSNFRAWSLTRGGADHDKQSQTTSHDYGGVIYTYKVRGASYCFGVFMMMIRHCFRWLGV